MTDRSRSFSAPAAMSAASLHAFLCCIVLALLPVQFSLRFWPGHDPISDPNNEQFATVLFVQICLIVLSGILRVPVRQWDLKPVFLLALVPLAIQATHTIQQADSGAASSLIRWIVLLAFGTAIFIGIRNRRLAISGNMAALTVAGAAIGYVALFTLVYAFPEERERLETIVIGFTNIRYTGYFVAPAIAILLVFAVRDTIRGQHRLIALGLAILLSAFTFYTGTRSTLFSVSAAALALILLSPGLRLWRLAPALLTIGLVGYGLAGLAPPPGDPNFMIASRPTGDSFSAMSSGRITIWLQLLEHWTNAPWFGFGEINIGPMIGSFIGQAHNSVLQNLLSVGLVGSAAIWILVALLFWRMLQALRVSDDDATPLIAGIACMFAHSMLDGPLFYSYPLALCALMVATFLASRTRCRQPDFARTGSD